MNAEQPPAVARHVDQLDSIEQVAQDSELDRALHIEEFDGIEELLDAVPNDREPPVLSRTRRRPIAHKPRRGPHISTDAQSHSPARTTAPTSSYAPASAVRRSYLPPDELNRARHVDRPRSNIRTSV